MAMSSSKLAKIMSGVSHPATCRCPVCNPSLGGRHPKLCQCRGCTDLRGKAYDRKLGAAVWSTQDAIRTGPTRERPVFVRAFWRKQKNYLRTDPGLRDWVLNERE